MGTLKHIQSCYQPVRRGRGVVVGGGGWRGGTECKGNQIPEKNAFCPREPEDGGLGETLTDGVMQRRLWGFPPPLAGM